jgi:outer membrane lipoprotein
MSNRFHWFLFLFFFIFLHSCAHVISNDLRAHADSSLTFNQVHQNPNAYKGKFVVLGGEIIETVNQKDGTTQIEVFQRPLGWRDEPKVTLASEGRFLILAGKYLDPYLYRRGKKITVAGEILGEEVKPLGEMDYRYPLLSSKQIYLWEGYYYRPYPYYYPWWYYDPWWSYPYGWWGFGFYYHH